MTLAEFEVQVDRLRNVFGDKAYSDERIKLIWVLVKNYEPKWFGRTVDELIGTMRQAPLLPEFRDAVARESERMNHDRKSKEPALSFSPKYSCGACKDTGVYICTHNTNKALYAFRCHCERGCNDSRKMIPQFKQEHVPDYTYLDMPRRA